MLSPVFILGNPRSGTTLLRLMLNNHRNIVVPPEGGFAVWFYEKYKNLTIDERVIKDYVLDISAAKKMETWNINYDQLTDYLLMSAPHTYSSLVSDVYAFYGQMIGKNSSRWGDKNNFYIHHIDTLNEIFPSAYLLHIIRDGRDVACSYKRLHELNIKSKYVPRLPSQITSIAAEWSSNIKEIRASFQKNDWRNVLEIKYEDLVSQPVNELKRVCDFLGESYDAEMENYFLRNKLEQQEPVEFLKWKAKTIERPTTSEVGKYKVELTETEIQSFESIAGSLLRIYNYID